MVGLVRLVSSSDNKTILQRNLPCAIIPKRFSAISMPRRIQGSSARSLSVLMPFVKNGSRYQLALEIAAIPQALLKQSGCPATPKAGTAFLPSALGQHTTANSQATETLDKSGYKETIHRMVYSSWNDWHGYPHSGIVARPYKRWPRIIHPPTEELLHIVDLDGKLHICSSICSFLVSEEIRNVHLVNIFFELFGEFDLFDETGHTLLAPKVRRVNWELLPKGEFPWEKAQIHIAALTKHLKNEDQFVIESRLRRIAGYGPELIALGRGGFVGYFAFGFANRKLFILESTELDNATYVFSSQWEQFSQLTKKEILCNNLQKERIIHDKRWKLRLAKLLK